MCDQSNSVFTSDDWLSKCVLEVDLGCGGEAQMKEGKGGYMG